MTLRPTEHSKKQVQLKIGALPQAAPSKLLDAQNIERLTLQIDHVLEEKARRECRPDAVAMAAGRYAAMQLFRTHGRAQAQAFFEDCLQTAEICDDILAQLDDDFV